MSADASPLLLLEKDELVDIVEEVQQTADELQRDLSYHRRKVTRLERELNEQRAADPKQAEARQVFDYWVKVFDKQRVVFGPARQKPVLARLKDGYSVHQLKKAIEGCKASEWHVENDKTDLELICRDEVKCDRFISLATHVPTTPADTRSPMEKLVAALEDYGSTVQDGFEGMTAQCPAHEDRQASLSISEKDDGTVLLNCHAGCTVESIVVEALGLRMADLFATTNVLNRDVQHREPAALPDEDDLAVWHRALMNNRTALDRLKARKGWSAETIHHFKLGLDDDKRIVIPRHDSVMRYAPNPQEKEAKYRGVGGRSRGLWPPTKEIKGDLIFIVEGEADAISAHELGLPATSIPGVSFAKSADQWAEEFRARKVVILLDCDKQGRTAGGQIIAALVKQSIPVKVCELDSTRDDGYDLSDLLVEHGPDRARGIIKEKLR